MSGTEWTITHEGKPLTWTRVVALGTSLASDRWEEQLAVMPVQFDVAKGLSSVQANKLLLWLKAWMPKTGHGLRLIPTIPTAEVAQMAPGRLASKPVRL